MWAVGLADIEHEKKQLTSRRIAVLERQASELEELDVSRSEIERLGRLVDAFAHKHQLPGVRRAPPPPKPLHAPAPAASNHHIAGVADKRAAAPERPHRRDFSGTNFDTFMRAVAKTRF